MNNLGWSKAGPTTERTKPAAERMKPAAERTEPAAERTAVSIIAWSGKTETGLGEALP